MSEKIRTTNAAALIYGETPSFDGDPAEEYHEASKLYPSFATRQIPGVYTIENNPNVAASVTRSAKQYRHAEGVALPTPAYPETDLATLFATRRSALQFSGGAATIEQLATIAHAAMGIVRRVPTLGEAEQTFRTAPSAGALYPLDLYVGVRNVEGLARGLYHYDPFAHRLESIRDAAVLDELGDAFALSDAPATASFVGFLGAMVWRTRFKYGQRSYRFVLLEAGHVVQNALLAATAFGLGSVAIGGFYDARADALLDLDGVNEATVYAFAVGVP